jgi:hypothetical protein
MQVVLDRTENDGVIRYLSHGSSPSSVRVERPTRETDVWHLGAHPDIVEHLWVRLNGQLPRDMRVLLADTAALADPAGGLVLAVVLGTEYAVRLTGEGLDAALAAEHHTMHVFTTVERTLDLAAAFGAGWVFGRFDEREGSWLRASLEDQSNL